MSVRSYAFHSVCPQLPFCTFRSVISKSNMVYGLTLTVQLHSEVVKRRLITSLLIIQSIPRGILKRQTQ